MPEQTARAQSEATQFPRRRLRAINPVVDLFFEFSTLGLVLCGYLAMLSTGTLDLPTSVVVSIALIYRAVALFGYLPHRVPGWLLGTLTLLSISLYPADVLWWSGDFIQATVHLIFLLALLKLLSAQGNRDHVALLVLSFLLLVVAAVLSSDALFFLFLLGFLTFSVMSFTSLELRRSLDVHKVVAAGARRLPLRLTLASALISAGIMGMSFGLFYALPRSAKAAFNQFMLHRSASPGFSKEIVLGRYGELLRNPAVVMRIREIPMNTRDASAPFPTHWRGATLTDFDGHRWSNSSERGSLTRITDNELFLASASQRRRDGVRGGYEVHVSSQVAEFLFLPGLAEFLRIEQNYVFRYADRSLKLPLAPKDDLEYAVFSFFDNEWELAEGRMASLSATELGTVHGEELLRLPPMDFRIEQLARSVTEGYDNPLDKARILSSYLRGNYRYSLSTSRSRSEQPLSAFLFETKEGHCEYFASALAVMLRSIGIPSRITTGFLATEYNPLTGWHIVRMSDAHSWVEVWLPDRGWYGFDPTPSTRQQLISPIVARMRLWQDAIDTFWQDWVIAYDFSRQMTLAGSAEAASRTLKEITASVLESLQESRHRLPYRQLSWLLAAVLSWWLYHRIRRRRRIDLLISESDDEASRLYAKMLRSLATRGYAKPTWQTSSEFVSSVSSFNGLSWLRDFTGAYHLARFGGNNEALEVMRSMVTRAAHVPKR